jgi:hypothetical protein
LILGLVIEADGRRKQFALRFEPLPPFSTQQVKKFPVVFDPVNILFQPAIETLGAPSRAVVLEIAIIIASGVTLGR